ncbi:AfsR/SARP family transcriptional regulator [Paractinoplanes brasiliensis]|uniref:AfsR/SARP family transcriptional regulator n=1 Tax=Paractinoplanes brasiliensis TaxID=52695 RepID=UPI0014151DDB|nr:BTAD domain-containing putative transcriptional regulator [Actinoplanes brasiliensis]GID30584.1 SARP family transcriptional regulator [Actinoplanes brasiliensis]
MVTEAAAAPAAPRVALTFDVLGPLAVHRNGRPVRLGPVQQQVVLAVLLLHGDRPLSVPAMIDAVWGENAPASAVNLVQRHVSGLRRVLEPDRAAHAATSRLAWTGSGYRLGVGDDVFDLARFEAAVRRARQARDAGDPKAAAGELRTALLLVRGPLCDGLSSPFLDAERERRAERVLGVLEDRIELDLAAGDAVAVVDELRRLVTEHPLRERWHELLMLALSRAGRRADALAAFQHARRLLRDELGVDPAAPLRQLHQSILAGETTGTEPPRTATAVPAQLPHALGDFVGREAELRQLDRLLDRDEAGVAAISGTAGVGKTTLAVTWAHRVRERFPEGQLYVNLRGFDPAGAPADPGKVIRGFLEALAVPPDRIGADPDAHAALYRSAVAGRRVLIVLDNALDADQVRPLLPGTPGCLVVVTSRNELLSLVALDGARPVHVDLMSPSQARDLIGRRLGRDRVHDEPAAVRQIIDACARLPLALSVVVARAAAHPQFPLSATAEELRRAQGSLDVFDAGDLVTNVRAVFACSYRALTAPAARLFRLLGLHPGPDISIAAAGGLAAVPAAAVRAQINELARAHLIAERAPGRFVLHDLLRAYAAELVAATESPDERRAAVRRSLDHYLHTAYAADRRLGEFRDDLIGLEPAVPGARTEQPADQQAALAWFAAEEPVLLASLRQAVHDGYDRHAWQLGWTLIPFLDRQGRAHDLAAAQELALAAAKRMTEPRGEAVTRVGLAVGYIRLGRYAEARQQLNIAYRTFENLGEHIGMGHARRSLAWVLDCEGEYHEALGYVQQALDHFRRGGHETGEARALNALGWFHSRLGEHEKALHYCRHALELQRRLGDRWDQADTLDSVGRAYFQLGRFDESADYYTEAIELYVEFGDRFDEGHALIALGDARAAAGDRVSAVAAWQRAAEVLEQLDAPAVAEARSRLLADRIGLLSQE